MEYSLNSLFKRNLCNKIIFQNFYSNKKSIKLVFKIYFILLSNIFYHNYKEETFLLLL